MRKAFTFVEIIFLLIIIVSFSIIIIETETGISITNEASKTQDLNETVKNYLKVSSTEANETNKN
jgi:type II secretory pathway pseudopilin PulG